VDDRHDKLKLGLFSSFKPILSSYLKKYFNILFLLLNGYFFYYLLSVKTFFSVKNIWSNSPTRLLLLKAPCLFISVVGLIYNVEDFYSLRSLHIV